MIAVARFKKFDIRQLNQALVLKARFVNSRLLLRQLVIFVKHDFLDALISIQLPHRHDLDVLREKLHIHGHFVNFILHQLLQPLFNLLLWQKIKLEDELRLKAKFDRIKLHP